MQSTNKCLNGKRYRKEKRLREQGDLQRASMVLFAENFILKRLPLIVLYKWIWVVCVRTGKGWFVVHVLSSHLLKDLKDAQHYITYLSTKKQEWNIPPTLSGTLRLTTHLSNAIAIAITAVASVLDDFVPGVSYLVESPGLRLLALICWSKEATSFNEKLLYI